MLLAVLVSNSVGNILVERNFIEQLVTKVDPHRFNGVPAEETLHWRSFLVKLGADNLQRAKNEELFVASHKSVYVVYTVSLVTYTFMLSARMDTTNLLVVTDVIFVLTGSVKDVCKRPPSERVFLDKYGKICLCIDEIVWKGILENTDKDRIKRLVRLEPPTDV